MESIWSSLLNIISKLYSEGESPSETHSADGAHFHSQAYNLGDEFVVEQF